MKKFSAILICFLILLACTFSGCAGFYRNDEKYHNKVVVKIDDYEITQFDIDNAYNSYSQYVSMGMYDEEEAREMAKNSLVDRRLLFEYIKDNKTYQPTIYQLNEIANNIIDSVINQMQTYVTTAKNKYMVIEQEQETTSETTETLYALTDYNKYTHRAILVENQNQSYTIEYNPENEAFTPPRPPRENETVIDYATIQSLQQDILNENLTNNYIKETVEAFKTKFKQSLNNYMVKIGDSNFPIGNNLYNESIALLCDDLMQYEYYLHNNSQKQEDLLFRYFKRNVDAQIQNQFINNLRINYLQTHTNELLVDELVGRWEEIAKFNKQQYDIDEESYKTKMKSISTDGDSVLYHPTELSDGTKFGYFIHILLESDNFTDAVKAAGENETDLNTAVANMRIKVRNADGSISSDTVSINQVQTEYNNIAKLQDYKTRLDSFIRLMFKYSSDPGLLSGGMPYVVGTNGNSNMNEPFTNEALALMSGETGNKIAYQYGTNAGNMSEFNSTKYNDLCVALNSNGNYGIHLIMFVEDVAAYDTIPTAANLKCELNPLTHETYFDMLFDMIYPAISDAEPYTSNNGYSDYEKNELIEPSRAKSKIIYY